MVRTRWLAWLELMTMAQKEDDPSTMEVQLLFMMPLVMGTFGLVPWESTNKKTGQVVEIHIFRIQPQHPRG